MKKRNLGIDLSGKSFVRLESIDVLGATVDLSEARNCAVSNGKFRYLSQVRAENTTYFLSEKTGILISGQNNILSGCEIAFSAGSGIKLEGENNTIFNCFVHDIDTSGCYEAPISMSGRSNRLAYSTIRDTGRDCVQYAGSAHLIEYNDISRAGRICNDLGAVYQFGTDGANTEIRYNWVHDVTCHMGQGIYLDNYTKNYIVHHNVCLNVEKSIQLNQPGTCVFVFNNTLFSLLEGYYSPWKGPNTMFGSFLANNLFSKSPKLKDGYQQSANEIHDFELPTANVDSSTIVYRGGTPSVRLEGINALSGVLAPIGAYDGKSNWKAGCQLDHPPIDLSLPRTTLWRNHLVNTSFDLSITLKKADPYFGWTQILSKKSKIISGAAPGFKTDTGTATSGQSVCLQSSESDGITQSVSSLKPGSEYLAACYVRLDDAKDVILKIDNGRGVFETHASESEGGVWKYLQIIFVATDSQATITFTKEGSGVAWVDDAAIVPTAKNAGNSDDKKK
jgi:hypothetical protein